MDTAPFFLLDRPRTVKVAQRGLAVIQLARGGRLWATKEVVSAAPMLFVV